MTKGNIKDRIKRAAVVLRVSTAAQKKDDQEDSVDNQLKWAKSWAESKGWEIVHVYDETVDKGYQSGRDSMNDRPHIQDLYRDAEHGEFDIALFRDNARLGRDDYEGLGLGRTLREHGVLVGLSKSGTIADYNNANDRLMFYIGQWQADVDFTNIVYNLRNGKFDAAVAGKWSLGSTPPKGWRVDRNTQEIEIDPEVAPFIKRMYEVVAAGVSVNEASNVIGPEFRAKVAKIQKAQKKENPGIADAELFADIGTSNRAIKQTLTNPAYRGDGIVRWAAHPDMPRGHKHEKKNCQVCYRCEHSEATEDTVSDCKGRMLCPDCGKHRFVFPAKGIVSAKLWKKANDVIGTSAKLTRPTDPSRSKVDWHDYGLPGGRVTHSHEWGSGDSYTVTGTMRATGRVYFCRASKIKAGRFTLDDPERCRGFGTAAVNGRRMTSISASLLEADVLAHLLPNLKDKEAIAKWAKAEDAKAVRELALDGDPETIAEGIAIEIAEIDGKKERAADSYIEGVIDRDKRDAKLATLETQRKTLIERRERIVATLERQEAMASTLDAILGGPVGYGPDSVALGSEVIHERDKDGLPVIEEWGWNDVAAALAGDAESVLEGRKKALNRDSVLWCQRLVEVFDIRVTIYGEDEEARPLWRIEGSIPLTPSEGSLYTSLSYGGIA